jgi:hypothetical protein
MLERLTQRCDLGLSEFEEICFINPDDVEGMYTLDEIVDFGSHETRLAIAKRLAAYEDSGLSPEQVRELAKAEAEGRLVVLPCKVGDTVYWFWTDGEGNPEGDIEEETVLCFYIDKDGVGIATKHYDGHIGCYVKDGELVDGVRRIFLTREAAEKALAEVGE